MERQWQVTNLAFHGCFVKPPGGVEFRPVMNCATYHCVWKVLVPALPVFNHTRDLKKAESEKKITLIESFPSRQMAVPFLSRTQFHPRSSIIFSPLFSFGLCRIRHTRSQIERKQKACKADDHRVTGGITPSRQSGKIDTETIGKRAYESD